MAQSTLLRSFKPVNYPSDFFWAGSVLFSSPEQRSRRAIVLPSAVALMLSLASASTNVKVFVKVFKTSLFPILITDLLHLWYDDTYWSKILRSTIPTTLGHVKVKVTQNSHVKILCQSF